MGKSFFEKQTDFALGMFLSAFWIVLYLTTFTLLSGNFYVTESGIVDDFHARGLNEFQITDIERGIFHWTKVTVKTKDSVKKTICFNSNIWFSYSIADCDHDSLGDVISDMPDPP